MRKAIRIYRVIAVLSVVLLFMSCNPIEDESDSASMLVLLSMQGYDFEGQEVEFEVTQGPKGERAANVQPL